jgi:hypothetical protein
MRKLFVTVAFCALAGAVLSAQARDIQDGKLQVKPAKEGKYIVDNAKLGKAELYGFVADYIETKKITGIVLRDGGNATDDQKHIIAITAKAQNIDAFVEIGGKEIALVDPMPAAPATPPPVDNVTPVTPPATPAMPATPASPATPAASATPASH